MSDYGRNKSILAREMKKRLEQLGMSRRELSRRVSISRQTLHELEHNPNKGFTNATLCELDKGLKWQAGTAKAFHEGKDIVGDMSTEQRIAQYLTDIVQRLAGMSVHDLEREVLMLEEENFGPIKTRNVQTSKLIDEAITKLVALLPKNGTSAKDATG